MNQPRDNLTGHRHSMVQTVVGLLIGGSIGIVCFFAATSLLNTDKGEVVVADEIEIHTSKSFRENSPPRETNHIKLDDGEGLSQVLALRTTQIEGIGNEELLRLVRQSRNLKPSPSAYKVQCVLLGELARIDPTIALEETWSFRKSRWTELIRVVFAEWAVLSQDDALRSAGTLKGTLRESAVHAILDVVDDLSEEDLANLALASEIEPILRGRIAEEEALRLLEHPERAWTLVVRDNVADEDQEALLLEIANVWLQSGSLDVLDYVYDDGLLDPFSASFPLRQKIESLIVERDPGRAIEYLLRMPAEKQRNAAFSLIRTLAEDDPSVAFESASRLPTSWTRKQAQSDVLYVWAQENPQELLKRVLDFPQNLRQTVVYRAVGSIARNSPEQAVKQLQRMETVLGAVNEEAVLTVVDQWVTNEPIAASNWARQSFEADSRVRARAMQRVVRQLAYTDPEEAINLALAEKPTSWNSESGLETYVFDSLVSQGKLQKAIEMLDRVRDSALSMSFYHVGIGLIESDRSNDAIQLAERLPEDKQIGYLTSLVFMWMRNPVDLLNKIPTMPSDLAKSEVARKALSMKNNTWTTLTDAQIEQLQAYVRDEEDSESHN